MTSIHDVLAGHGIHEQHILSTAIPENLTPNPYFGEFITHLKANLTAGGSEFGLGLTLFALAASIRAKTILEIGRFKGFSTIALAAALKLQTEADWHEQPHNKQRPDIDYDHHESQPCTVHSVDFQPQQDAVDAIKNAKCDQYVQFINCRSQDFTPPPGTIYDLQFIDGEHSHSACVADVSRFLPLLRPGGYIVLHDYFGWYDREQRNNSPIKDVAEFVIQQHQLQHLLVDTGYQSLIILRKP